VLARRDVRGREGKQTIFRNTLSVAVPQMLEQIQAALLEKATTFREANTVTVDSYEDFKAAVSKGFARVWWAGSNADEKRIQEETRATLRCLPLEQPDGEGRCFFTGRPAKQIAIFARSY
jgi:prolyl-tRNA synthetase